MYHLGGFSAVSAQDPGILCHPAESSALMKLGRKPQLWVQHKRPFCVLLADTLPPLATRPSSTSAPAALRQQVPAAAVHPSLGSQSCQEAGSCSPCLNMSLTAKEERHFSALHFLKDQAFYLLPYDILLEDSTFCYWLPSMCF